MTNAAGRSRAFKYSSTRPSTYITLTVESGFHHSSGSSPLLPLDGHLLLQVINWIIVSSHQLGFELPACTGPFISYTAALQRFWNHAKHFAHRTPEALKRVGRTLQSTSIKQPMGTFQPRNNVQATATLNSHRRISTTLQQAGLKKWESMS